MEPRVVHRLPEGELLVVGSRSPGMGLPWSLGSIANLAPAKKKQRRSQDEAIKYLLG